MALESLGLCLLDGGSDVLTFFKSRYGELASLTTDDISKVTTAVQIEIGGLFRRFLVRFRCYPRRLAYLIAEGVSDEDRMRVAVQFCTMSLCCLDEMFGRWLRKLIARPQDLFLELVLNFLRGVFRKAFATTVHSEDSFAHMRHFLTGCRRPPHISTLAAIHVLKECRRIHRAWRSVICKGLQKRLAPKLLPAEFGKHRRMWANKKVLKQRKKSRTNAFSVFVAQRLPELRVERPRDVGKLIPKSVRHAQLLRSVTIEWKAMSPEAKRPHKIRASLARAERNMALDPLKDFE